MVVIRYWSGRRRTTGRPPSSHAWILDEMVYFRLSSWWRCFSTLQLCLTRDSVVLCCVSAGDGHCLLLRPDREAEYCDEPVCVSVCVCVWERECVCLCLFVHEHIVGTTRPIFTNVCVHVAYGRGSVLLWRRNDTLCTSGFMDHVISQGYSTSPPSWRAVHTQPWAWL